MWLRAMLVASSAGHSIPALSNVHVSSSRLQAIVMPPVLAVVRLSRPPRSIASCPHARRERRSPRLPCWA
jgi:hypothetical protein